MDCSGDKIRIYTPTAINPLYINELSNLTMYKNFKKIAASTFGSSNFYV